MLYELIAGRTPFRRDSEGATLKAIMEDSPEPLTRYKADVPDKLQEIVIKLHRKDPNKRYDDEMNLLNDLSQVGAELGLQLYPAIPR